MAVGYSKTSASNPRRFTASTKRGDVRFPRFGFSAARARGSMLAPVIENVRNVHDFSRPLGGAQSEIVVLGEIEFLAETTHGNGKLAAISTQMADIHERVEQFGTPFRFEEWFRPFP